VLTSFICVPRSKLSVSFLTIKRPLSRSLALSWTLARPLGHHALRYTSLCSALLHTPLSVSNLPINSWVRFSQRFVVIANDDTIETVIVEENASDLTVTEATRVLALL
jgi:hypothetical protein